MDDETIARRDAIAGLGLMGTLLVALVGTIVVRIVNSSRDDARPPRSLAATVDDRAEADAAAFASSMSVEAKPASSNAADVSADVILPAAHDSAQPAPSPLESPMAKPPIETEAPRFVAPTGR